jgi:hypothetical protein
MTQEAQSEERRNTTRAWILFLITTAILIYMMIFVNEWFWVALPFSLTYFVWAMRVI